MQIEEFKTLLEQKRSTLNERLDSIKGDFSQNRSADFSDQATESENDDVLKRLEYEANQEIHQINDALQRIKTGDFGYCEQCGESISEERLHVIPFTQFCKNCAK